MSLAKKGDPLKRTETLIRDIRAKYLPILEKGLGDRQPRLELAVYMDLIIRCLFAKPWPALSFTKVTLPKGHFTGEDMGPWCGLGKVPRLQVHGPELCRGL